MLVTPLRDGMNLVAKEFVASRVDDDGVLVLASSRAPPRSSMARSASIPTTSTLSREASNVGCRCLRRNDARG